MELDGISAAFEQAAVTQGSGTLGWDAICAIDMAGLNRLLFAWYLRDNPAAPVASLRTGFDIGSRSFLLDLTLGPPAMTLSPGSADDPPFTVTRAVLTGAVTEYDVSTREIRAVTSFGPDTATLSARLNLTKVSGTAGDGSVELHLGAGTTQLDGTALDTTIHQAVNAAITSYDQACPTAVKLCSVSQSSVGPWLQPTAFELATQPNPADPKGGCALILITTNGTPGQLQHLPAYPIPDGSTAVLMVSNRVIFKGLLPDQLGKTSSGVTWVGTQEGPEPGWAAQVEHGSADVGVLTPSALSDPFTSDGTSTTKWFVVTVYNKSHMLVDLAGLTLQPQGGVLLATYSHTWNQGWAYTDSSFGSYSAEFTRLSTSVTYRASSPVTITNPDTCVVTFPWNAAPTCTTDMSSLQGIFEEDPGRVVIAQMKKTLTDVFAELTVAEIDTFALQNLLFYPNQSLSLSTGSLPGDLLLIGHLTGEITVTPQVTHAAPGGPAVQFSAPSLGHPLVWQVTPLIGTISDGLYSPPAKVARPTLVRVSVSDGTVTGGAVILVGADGGATTTSPATSSPFDMSTSTAGPLRPGATVTVTASGPPGQPTEGLTWIAVPPGIGTLQGDGTTATYTAPAAGIPGTRPNSIRFVAYARQGDEALFGFADIPLRQP